MNFETYLSGMRHEVDAYLQRLLLPDTEEPSTIHRAMRYSVFAGGKRLRPALVMAAGESAGGDHTTLLHLAASIELIHTYSLIHDDLPALDNDDLRRGHPTCHKVFGEAIAILAGDALMTRSYQALCDLPGVPDSTRLLIVREVAYATGTREGMIGGQVVDLESEGKPIGAKTLEYIHRSKTGALLTACTRCGALAAGAPDELVKALTRFGQSAGLAFQVVDDILDVTRSTEQLGKTAGKDQQVHKATYPALFGIEASVAKARDLVASALAEIRDLGDEAGPLRAIAGFILARTK